MTADGEQGISLRAVGRSALVLTGGTAAVQVLGIIRELYVAAAVGISRDLDGFLVALVLPTTLAGVLTSGTVTALVPAYLEARDQRGREGARRLAGTIGVWVGLAGLLTFVALEAFAAPAIALAGPGLAPATRESATGYLQLLAPVVFVSVVTGILYGVCQAEERFGAIAWSAMAGSATTLFVMLVLWPSLGLGALAAGNLAGPMVTAAGLLAVTVRTSISPRPTLWTSRDELAAFARHAVPLTISGAVLQVNVVADRAIASLIAPGAVSALRYAEVLVRTPISAIGPSWGAALYPALARSARETGSRLSDATDRSLRFVLAVFTPLATLTIAVAPVAVAVAYARGAFTAADVDRTARAVAAFAPLMVVLMASPSLTGALNARRRGGALLAGGVLSVGLNVTLDVALGLLLGAAGVALSSSITSFVVLSFFAWRLASSEPAFAIPPIAHTLAVAALASLPGAIVIGIVCWAGVVPAGFLAGLAALAVFGVAGIACYLVIAPRLGLDEARTLIEASLGWLASRRGSTRPSP